MNCAEINLRMGEMLDLELSPELAEFVKTHLSTCAPCRSTLEQLESLRAALRSSVRHTASAALDDRVMRAFQQHHDRRQPAQPAARGWKESIFGSISIPRPALIMASLLTAIAVALGFSIGRITASREALAIPPVATNPAIVEVPVERERIVYVKTPGQPRQRKSPSPRPTSSEATASKRPARDFNNSGGDWKPEGDPPKIASLESFEPIKGATARVIEGSKQR